ncbi:MAG: metallophosphoesterase family protein [Dehalococcoidales bacterium]|nr:metallophosphoesterase family protein [Dehalococcoidales bacterium]
MRCAVLADIHSNLEALTAVFRDIEVKGGADEVWCLGDIVGYGPEPAECIKLLRKFNPVCVAGNHDLGTVGKMELSFFNPAAAQACIWSAEKLGPEDLQYLEELPQTVQKGDFLLAHGSPASPLLEYVASNSIAEKNFSYFDKPYCLVGHTHVPQAYKQEDDKVASISLSSGIGLVLKKSRLIINPGAVGQPRDGDPRASYAIYDSEGSIFRVYRVEYGIRATQDKMMQAGLPVSLVTRLEVGR